MVLGGPRGVLGLPLGSPWAPFGLPLGLPWVPFGLLWEALGVPWGYFGTILALLRGTLRVFGGHFWCVGATLGHILACLVYFYCILVTC